MSKSPEERVTSVLGREICQRQSLKAMVTGSIASLGSQYVIMLNATDCQSGNSIARVQAEAANKESVLRALGTATVSLRSRLGESLGSVQKFDARLEEATTASLEALKAYTLGRSLIVAGKAQEAIPALKHSIELDPNFASAYGALGTAYTNLGERTLRNQSVVMAYERRDRVTEHERLDITARYHRVVTGDLLKEFETLTLLQQTYPRAPTAFNLIGIYYSQLGQFDRAADSFREAVRLRPGNAV